MNNAISMQISKTRNGYTEVPAKACLVTPRPKRPMKVTGSESNTSSAINQSKHLSDRSPKIECRPTKASETEKRRPSRVTELECQISQLQEDLKKTRDQLNLTESWKRRAQQEAEEAKKELLVMSLKLEDSQGQMEELSTAEEARIQELRKISQERDRAWQSELEAIQNQHSVDTAALASAMNEMRRLKLQLEMVLRSEAALAKKSEADRLEIQSSKTNLAEASFTIENLKVQLRSSEKAESDAKSTLTETRRQLEAAQSTIESLLSDGSKLMESFSIVATELKESRSRVKPLEETVKKLQQEQFTAHIQPSVDLGNPKKICFGSSDSEAEQLMSALEDALVEHQQEQILSMVKLQRTYEMMDKMSADSRLRESELKLRLSEAESEIAVLQTSLFDREVELRRISDMNKKLVADIDKRREHQIQSEAAVISLKSKLADKETALRRLSEDNEKLKLELRRVETEKQNACEAAVAETMTAKTALTKLGFISEEAEKNSERATRAAEELKAAQAAKTEMEAELRRLKVQAEQWRKAAETAIVMLTADQTAGAAGKLMSLQFGDLDDESPGKKKSHVLGRIRGMWNKDQK
ncbi:Interactor of constitutive active ROPs [Musa troglodytarum]|nr:Interactor of constitutive active ROPs [Musa troglodytarum]URD75006.1 Interactor of constitutive active ROPs [Musa troglodytarum]